MVERIVRQTAQANEKLTGNVDNKQGQGRNEVCMKYIVG